MDIKGSSDSTARGSKGYETLIVKSNALEVERQTTIRIPANHPDNIDAGKNIDMTTPYLRVACNLFG